MFRDFECIVWPRDAFALQSRRGSRAMLAQTSREAMTSLADQLRLRRVRGLHSALAFPLSQMKMDRFQLRADLRTTIISD